MIVLEKVSVFSKGDEYKGYDAAKIFAEGKAKIAEGNKAIMAKIEAEDAEIDAEYAKWEAERAEMIAKWEAEEAEREEIEKYKIENELHGLYDEITGRRIPYMNDEGDHIDFDHDWYD